MVPILHLHFCIFLACFVFSLEMLPQVFHVPTRPATASHSSWLKGPLKISSLSSCPFQTHPSPPCFLHVLVLFTRLLESRGEEALTCVPLLCAGATLGAHWENTLPCKDLGRANECLSTVASQLQKAADGVNVKADLDVSSVSSQRVLFVDRPP